MPTEIEELPCEREFLPSLPTPGTNVGSWWCINDHTGCLYNDGHNTCHYEGNSLSPLEDN